MLKNLITPMTNAERIVWLVYFIINIAITISIVVWLLKDMKESLKNKEATIGSIICFLIFMLICAVLFTATILSLIRYDSYKMNKDYKRRFKQ